MQDRLERMRDLGLESEVRESQNLLCGVYVLLNRYEEAALLAITLDRMAGAFLVADAHVGAGEYEKALSFLPGLTARGVEREYLLFGDLHDALGNAAGQRLSAGDNP